MSYNLIVNTENFVRIDEFLNPEEKLFLKLTEFTLMS